MENEKQTGENDYARFRADEVEKLIYGLGIRKHSKAIAAILEREIREAVAVERKASR